MFLLEEREKIYLLVDEDEEGDGTFWLQEEGDKENEEEDKKQLKAFF